MDDREQYIDEHLNRIRDRQAAELAKAKRYFGEEWDMEHLNDEIFGDMEHVDDNDAS